MSKPASASLGTTFIVNDLPLSLVVPACETKVSSRGEMRAARADLEVGDVDGSDVTQSDATGGTLGELLLLRLAILEQRTDDLILHHV